LKSCCQKTFIYFVESENMTVSVQQVVDAQVHIGTLKNEAHPKTNKYRADIVN
jgi:ribosomal protein S2